MPASTSPRGDGPPVAAFLDRDGTVILDRDYPDDPEGVELLPGAAGAISRLNRAGVPVVLVTNQSGIGRGYFEEPAFHAVQRRVEELLEREGARVDGVYFCPHAPEAGCECRKPAPGLYRRAAREHGLSLQGSYFVGDRLRDVLPARELGGSAFLLRGHDTPLADPASLAWVTVVESLEEAVGLALGPVRSD